MSGVAIVLLFIMNLLKKLIGPKKTWIFFTDFGFD